VIGDHDQGAFFRDPTQVFRADPPLDPKTLKGPLWVLGKTPARQAGVKIAQVLKTQDSFQGPIKKALDKGRTLAELESGTDLFFGVGLDLFHGLDFREGLLNARKERVSFGLREGKKESLGPCDPRLYKQPLMIF
jgi:hypothetical protein